MTLDTSGGATIDAKAAPVSFKSLTLGGVGGADALRLSATGSAGGGVVVADLCRFFGLVGRGSAAEDRLQ